MYDIYSDTYEDYLMHHGVKGMKWGVRKSVRRPGFSRAARENRKVDKSFKKWKESDEAKAKAINSGKKRNLDKLSYMEDSKNKEKRKQYKQSEKQYKKDLKKNTTYRKGAVRQEVNADLSRKYLSKAKKYDKAYQANPSSDLKKLARKYDKLHEQARYDSRRATEVSSARSKKKAAIKRGITIGAKSAAATAAIAVGVAGVNKVLKDHNTTLDGKPLYLTKDNVKDFINVGVKVKKFMDLGAKFMY